MTTSYSIEAESPVLHTGTTGDIVSFIFDVYRDGDVAGTSDVPWAVTGVVNIDGSEFVGGHLPASSLHFNAGQQFATIQVNVVGGSVVGADASFLLALGAQSDVTTGISDSASGGYGVTHTAYVVSGGGGTVDFTYEMYSIPDRGDVLLNGVSILTTGGAVSNGDTLSYSGPIEAGDQLTVIMSGYDPGTAWDYSIVYTPGISEVVQAQATILANPQNTEWSTTTDYDGSWTTTSIAYPFDEATGEWIQSGFSGVFDSFNYLAENAQYYAGVGKETLLDVVTELGVTQIEDRIAAESPEAAEVFGQAAQAVGLYQTPKTFVHDSFELIDEGTGAIMGKNDMTPDEFDARANEIATNLQQDLVLSLIDIPLVGPIVKGVQRIVQHSDLTYQLHLGSSPVTTYSGHQYAMLGGDDSDTFFGSDQRDVLWGGAGDDTLYGGSGDDWVLGSSGADWLSGGSGNDTYLVDDAGDVIIETSGAWWDWVYSSVDYALADNVEVLILTGSAVHGSGNAIGNLVVGSDGHQYLEGLGGNDVLDGGRGADKLVGGGGRDIAIGGPGADTLNGGSGIDTVSYVHAPSAIKVDLTSTGVQDTHGGGKDRITGFENVFGSDFGDRLLGDSGANRLAGADGADTLNGRAGNDHLVGGRGADTFVLSFKGASDADVVVDFKHGVDHIALAGSVFAGLSVGTLTAGAFHAAAGAQEGADAGDRVIYDKTSGNLYYDPDGVGGSVSILVATLGAADAHPALSATDIVVI